MDELGNILREAREAKGLTLSEVQEEIRISTKFLAAMENGQYNLLPTPVHAKGYLRNYARFLNLDPAPLLERYEFGANSKPKKNVQQTPSFNGDLPNIAPLPLRDDQPFFDPVNVELSGKSGSSGSGAVQRLILIIAFLIALALIANRFIPFFTGNGDGSEAVTSGITETVNNIINNNVGGSDFATATPDVSLIPGAGEVITSTGRNVVDIPTPTATRPTLPATLDVIRLRLDITERTWMQVTIDGEIVFEGMARKGDEPYQWEAQQDVTLLTGNANGIFVTINEIELGKLGGRGEVVEETWNTTGNQ